MGFYSPDEIIANFGGLSGKKIILEDVTYTIDHVKTVDLSPQLQAHLIKGTKRETVPINRFAEYDFPDHDEIVFKNPTKKKNKGRRRNN